MCDYKVIRLISLNDSYTGFEENAKGRVAQVVFRLQLIRKGLMERVNFKLSLQRGWKA